MTRRESWQRQAGRYKRRSGDLFLSTESEILRRHVTMCFGAACENSGSGPDRDDHGYGWKDPASNLSKIEPGAAKNASSMVSIHVNREHGQFHGRWCKEEVFPGNPKQFPSNVDDVAGRLSPGLAASHSAWRKISSR